MSSGDAETRPQLETLRLALRLAATAGAVGLWWLVADLDPGELRGALSRMPASALGAVFAIQLGGITVGAVRWSLLLRAYGARRVPPIPRLVRIYLVGTFFNTFLPANVGGDVLRGHVTRDAFGGGASSYLVVLVERIFGLAGLFLLTGTILFLHPMARLDAPPWLGVAGIGIALTATSAPALARRLGGRLPGRLGALAADLPQMTRPALVVGVALLSVVTQLAVALSGWVLVSALAPGVRADEALVLVPLAMLSVYVPTVAGLGARETAFVVLFGLVGVPAADATAASVAYLGVQLLLAATGGVVHFVAGSGADFEPPDPTAPTG